MDEARLQTWLDAYAPGSWEATDRDGLCTEYVEWYVHHRPTA
jgi:hypothetical protein